MKVEFGVTRFSGSSPSEYFKINHLWNSLSTKEKKEGLTKSGYLNNLANVNFYIKKIVLKKLKKL